MSSTRHTTVLTGFVVLLMVTALLTPVAYADSHQSEQPTDGHNTTYRIVQGDQAFQVKPIEGNVPVEEFYAYHYPYQDRDNPSWGRSFSSEGTTEYQQDSTSILMLYEGPNGVSLVAIHDKYHEERQNGTAGSSVSWEISGLPDDGEWAVIDDDYDWRNESVEKDDIHQLSPDHRTGAAGTDGEPPEGVDARLSWVWTTGRSDGMAYRGLDDNVSITIDPAFNENSYHRYGDQRRPDEEPDQPYAGSQYNGTIDDWQVISATDNGDDYKRIWFDSLEETVQIESSDQSDLSVGTLSGPSQATVGEAIEFGTNGTTGEIERYQWTVNGTPVESANGSTMAYTFEQAGTAEVELTVTTANGLTDTESRTVEVSEGEETTGGEQVPGFGPVVAVLALLAVMLLAARRTTS